MSIKISNLTKKFADQTVFDGFSYEFSEKGVYCIVGESGAGKTTLLRIIAGLDKDYSGEILGTERVSFAFQEYRLFPQLSAVDNLIYANFDKKDEAVYNLCKNMLISLGFSEDDIDKLPSELSGGMKQRVSLARAFIRNAPVVLLDEPTKELDEANAALVTEKIRMLGRSALVIVVSHNRRDPEAMNATVIKI